MPTSLKLRRVTQQSGRQVGEQVSKLASQQVWAQATLDIHSKVWGEIGSPNTLQIWVQILPHLLEAIREQF